MVAEPVGECGAMAAVWTTQVLMGRFDALGRAFALPRPEWDSALLQSEAAALVTSGNAEACVLASVCIAVARCTICPPVAYGLWAGSALLSQAGAVLGSGGAPQTGDPPTPELADARRAHATLLAHLSAGSAGPIRLLVPVSPDPSFFDALRESLARLDLPLVVPEQADGALRLTLSQHGATVEIAPSALWRAVQLLAEQVQRTEGYVADVLDLDGTAPGAGELLAGPLGAALPEMPRWAAGLGPAPDVWTYQRAWLDACPAQPAAAVAAALVSRAAMAWRFAALAARAPSCGWPALLGAIHGDAAWPAMQDAGTGLPAEVAAPVDPDRDPRATASDEPTYGDGRTAAPGASARILHFGDADLRVSVAAGTVLVDRVDRWAPESEAAAGATIAQPAGGPIQVTESVLSGGTLCLVHLQIALTGDRTADLALIERVRDALRAVPGPLPIRVVLQRAGARRMLDAPLTGGVAWSADLARSLEDLAGPGCVSLRPSHEAPS